LQNKSIHQLSAIKLVQPLFDSLGCVINFDEISLAALSGRSSRTQSSHYIQEGGVIDPCISCCIPTQILGVKQTN